MSNSNTPLFSVIVAGGSGSRMKNVIPKQFLLLHDKPILSITVETFLRIPSMRIVLVLPKKDMLFWEEIVESSALLKTAVNDGRIITAIGGATRFQSVNNGLNAIDSSIGLVAIHDGVRPLISMEKIELSFQVAKLHQSAILSVEVKDSVRVLNENGSSKIIDRNELRLIQTPQTFDLKTIKEAYTKGEQPYFTDDASVFEAAGHSVHLIEGTYENIKITTPEDLLIAEALLKK
jgi:2-C-methyl-D-erythritol 4-phosphate cytidylyltransferase